MSVPSLRTLPSRPAEGYADPVTEDVEGLPADRASLGHEAWRSATESEARYRSLVEQLPAVVFVDLFQPELATVYISPIVETMLGYTPSAFYADNDLWDRSLHGDDQAWVMAEFEAAVASETPYDLEYRLIGADGRIVWVRDRAAPLRSPAGATIGWQGVMLDITAQKAAEQELRLSEARHRAQIEQLPAVAYIASDEPDLQILFISPTVQEILGYSPDFAPTSGQDWTEPLSPDDRERAVKGWLEALETGEPFDMEYRTRHADGHDVWVHDHAVLVRDATGKRLHWQGIMVDISARVQAERELAVSETRFRTLVEGIPAVVYEMGPDDERRTIYANPRIEQLFGYTRHEWLDQPDIWIELLHPDDRENELAAHDRHSETGEPWSREYRLIAADGRTVWVHDQATLVRDEQGRPLTWLGLMVDITAQKEAEERLRLSNDELEFRDLARTAELEEANELMALEIAERRRAERDLRAAEERYRRLVEEVPAVVYTWQLRPADGGVSLAYANPQVHRMLGYTPDEWIAGWDSWVEQLHPHDRVRVLAAAVHSYRTGEPFEAEYRYFAKDGRVVWVVDRATLLTRTDDGEPLLFQGVMIDVTAQKEAERKAVRAEERFRELTEVGPVVTYSFRVDHAHDPPMIDVDYVSPQAAALLRLPPAAHGGMESWLSAVHPHDRDLFVAQAQDNLAGGAPWVFEYRTIDTSGTVLWLEDRGSCVARDRQGRPARFVGILSDITSRRLLQEAEETERISLRAMIENLPAVPWAGTIDTATGGMRLSYVGPQVQELLGVTPDELLRDAEPLSGWIHPDDRARVAAERRAAAEEAISHLEYRVVHRDGSVRRVRAMSRRATPPGETPQVWNGLMIDVSSQHRPVGTADDEDDARAERTPLR